MKSGNQPAGWQIGMILTIGILATSTAAVLVRLAIASAGVAGVGFSLVMAASRLSCATIVLLPVWRDLLNRPPSLVAVRYAGAAGMALAVHFATWITSLSYTSITASTTLVTTNPVWVALLAWLWWGEKPRRLTLVGMAIALVGAVLIGLGGSETLSAGPHPLLGNGLALVGAWMASLYFLLGREAQRQGLGIGSYAAIAYGVAAIVLLPLPLLVGTAYTGYSTLTYSYIGLMALLPQLVGHTSLNWSVRWVSPTLVTLAILFEPVMSSVLGYLIFGEVPGASVLVGACVLLVGVGMATMAAKS